MCAIAGMINLRAEEAVIRKMLQTMARRGPDGSGCYFGENCMLLHTRLAVIDPEGGKQPMEVTWAGETYVISYNGELYNTEELRSKLIRLGHVFRTRSDTEVVLRAYAQWGEAALEQFNGIFAFAVWHKKEKILFLARDRIGVKPLFYMRHEGGLIFASEIKTILSHPTVEPVLTAEGAAQLLLLGPGRIPGSGIFHGVMELEPGCCGYYKENVLQVRRYWSLKDREHRDSLEETAETVRWLLTDAIRRQMVSDVPIGTFLSGGLDSSLISTVCAEEMARLGKTLDTFSVEYQNNEKFFVPGKFQPEADDKYIGIMCGTLKSNHHKTVLTPQALLDAMEDATCARDLPGMADVDFSLLAFCREIREHVTVALSGECADEIFGGYPWYRDPEVRSVAGFPWAQNTNERAQFLSPDIVRQVEPNSFINDLYRQTVDSTDILPGTEPEERRIKEMVNLNYRWFMQTLLDRKDRMSMHCALEVRVPFCDYRIAEYLYGVPWAYKDHNGREKGLLRMAMEGILPNDVLWRKKSPYPKTHDPAYSELVNDRLRRLLHEKDAPIFGIVKREALENLLTASYSWPWYGQLMKVPQTVAYMLQLDFWLRHYRVSLR